MNFSLIQNAFFILTLTGISFFFFWVLSGFVFPIFFAVVLTIVFYPLHKKFLKLFKGKKNLAATFSLFSMLLFIIIPVISVSSLILKESASVYQSISSEDVSLQRDIFLEKYDAKIRSSLESFNLDYEYTKEKALEIAKTSLEYITSKGLSFGKDTFSVFISFLIMTYIMFYFFRDGTYFLHKISKAIPLGDGNEKKAFHKFSLIIKSIFKGSLVVALVQGLIGAVFLYIAGVEGLFLWTILMIVLAIIPALGPTIVLIPTSIFFFFIGDTTGGIVLALGSIVVSVSDNILRPIFIGTSIKMHDLMLTLSILGGIGVFGILGFIIGPVVAGLFVFVWEVFETSYKKELSEKG